MIARPPPEEGREGMSESVVEVLTTFFASAHIEAKDHATMEVYVLDDVLADLQAAIPIAEAQEARLAELEEENRRLRDAYARLAERLAFATPHSLYAMTTEALRRYEEEKRTTIDSLRREEE